MECLKGASLRKAVALLVNIRPGCKGLTETGTLANLDHSSVTEKNSFVNTIYWFVNAIKVLLPGTLAEGEDSLPLTSSVKELVLHQR
jgi:hypothetical protein